MARQPRVDDVVQWAAEVDTVGDRIGRHFARSEPRQRAVGYVRASVWSIRESACNAVANANSDRSIAYPFIGAGSGCGWSARVRVWMKDELQRIDFDGIVVLVRFKYSKALP